MCDKTSFHTFCVTQLFTKLLLSFIKCASVSILKVDKLVRLKYSTFKTILHIKWHIYCFIVRFYFIVSFMVGCINFPNVTNSLELVSLVKLVLILCFVVLLLV